MSQIEPSSSPVPASANPPDLAAVVSAPDVQDLVFSYLRIASPNLRRAAVSSIRALAEASRPESQVA
ncbi:MAG TPA: hypothetical protein VIJ94_14270 [Caulobacteraceae bacterium]